MYSAQTSQNMWTRTVYAYCAVTCATLMFGPFTVETQRRAMVHISLRSRQE